VNVKNPIPADLLVVTFKGHVAKEKAMEIVYAPEANGTLFSEREDEMWGNLGAAKAYSGRWNYTQMCYFEHLPEVSHVGVTVVQLGLYGSGLPGNAW
jgi:hypothetical protein